MFALSLGYTREKGECWKRLGVCKKVEEKVPEFKAAELQWRTDRGHFVEEIKPPAAGSVGAPLGPLDRRGGRAPSAFSVLLPVANFCKYPMIDDCGLHSYCINDDFILNF